MIKYKRMKVIKLKNLRVEALKLHEENQGKLGIYSKVKVTNAEDLALAYSPGVAEPCKEIYQNDDNVYRYTSKGNMIAVITDGTAVLGLGNIGPKAALPVMEGKCILFKEFADIDAIPICLNTNDTEEIIQTIKLISPSFGGINLEDISAPRCVEIEQRLKGELDIPVFHDDQHGTAIVTLAALINCGRLQKRDIRELKYVISGMGAAGTSIARILKLYGVKTIYGTNAQGIISRSKYHQYNSVVKDLLDQGILSDFDIGEDNLSELVKKTDCFIGVSVANILTASMIDSMNDNPIVFALANPNPEITYEESRKSKVSIFGTGRSDYPNQINNVLAFPGIFRGALDAKSYKITEEMKIAASLAIASIIQDSELHNEYVIPSPFDHRVVKAVSEAVYQKAKELNICRE